MARLSLTYLAGIFALGAGATEDEVADTLEAELKAGKEARSHGAKLEADILALSASVQQAESARDAALLALESIPPAPAAPEPAPAATAKYKPGDKVMYREKEMPVIAAMGPEMVYEFEGGECGPESRCQSMSSPVAVAFAGNHRVLTAYAARVAGHTMSAEQLRSLAMATANGTEALADVLAKIDASVPSNAQRQAVARGVLEALAPAATAKPVAGTSDRQAKIRNRVYGGK